ncbi:ribonuclease HII [Butyrivibrio sp. CB08]|uniref:ribonuclease HII n=1 Tax=Butyrivibrio sp. CB08 TaxID=2364879 RepID=UPI000EAAA027|nr:ribonuclease HII [Butyrivibrio sp. CB08]RKM57620.1 ribonuclease HII [Butyrivibrio sp. CB08]
MQSLSDIKGILQTSQSEQELKSFIDTYSLDERAGVRKLVESALKKIDSIEKEKKRTYEMYWYEREYQDCGLLCGIDEVGRGPLAGPVYAAAVILKPDCPLLYLNDSKKLSEKKREELYDVIMEEAVSVSIGFSTCERIDEINILNATYEAMTKAVNGLSEKPGALLIDAVHIPQLEMFKQVSIIKGDAKSASIAAASIIAKVTRDRVMKEMAIKYPEYGFDSNKGYGSEAHIAALKKYGPCEIHRRSFIGNFV